MKINTSTERHHYLDWLRVIGVLIVFCFHTSMIFVSWNWHINNSESSFIMDTFVRFVHLWIMPMFFVLAGASAIYSLRKRTSGEYISERFKRLLIPIIGGVLFLIPPQIYLERFSTAEFSGSYLQFYPHFFEGLYPNGNFTLNHLWFVLYLFLISIISLPLFKKGISFPGMSSTKPWIVIFPLIAIVAVETSLRYIWPIYLYPADILIFLIYFMCGYYIASNSSVSAAIKKYSLLAFLIGLVMFSVITVFYYQNMIPSPESSWGYVAFQIFWSMTGWFWVVAIMGLGLKKLNRPSTALSRINEAVLPFYIIHQTVILVMAYYIVQWEMSLAMKFLFILISALLITVMLYHLIRLFNVTRVMFGLKRKANKTLEIERVPQNAFWASDN